MSDIFQAGYSAVHITISAWIFTLFLRNQKRNKTSYEQSWIHILDSNSHLAISIWAILCIIFVNVHIHEKSVINELLFQTKRQILYIFFILYPLTLNLPLTQNLHFYIFKKTCMIYQLMGTKYIFLMGTK